jgi:hypothetical protein
MLLRTLRKEAFELTKSSTLEGQDVCRDEIIERMRDWLETKLEQAFNDQDFEEAKNEAMTELESLVREKKDLEAGTWRHSGGMFDRNTEGGGIFDFMGGQTRGTNK